MKRVLTVVGAAVAMVMSAGAGALAARDATPAIGHPYAVDVQGRADLGYLVTAVDSEGNKNEYMIEAGWKQIRVCQSNTPRHSIYRHLCVENIRDEMDAVRLLKWSLEVVNGNN